MFICIDGSGPLDLGEYRSVFTHSFLRQAQAASTQTHNPYFEGPDSSGLLRFNDLTAIATRAIALHRQEVEEEGDSAKVFLGGYSRGAAGIVHVAYLLEDMHIAVDGMFLFDAVDRSPYIGDSLRVGNVDEVPANVRAVYHAMRHPDSESRESFGHTAIRAANPGSYCPAYFLTTHGGMGGVLWGSTGLDRSTRGAYTSRLTPAERRRWIRDHATLVEPFVDGSDGVDEAVAAYELGELSDGRTTLTMATEESGAQECIDWMWAKMSLLGAVRSGTHGYVSTELSRAVLALPDRSPLHVRPGAGS